jgi:hypothetical protein
MQKNSIKFVCQPMTCIGLTALQQEWQFDIICRWRRVIAGVRSDVVAVRA